MSAHDRIAEISPDRYLVGPRATRRAISETVGRARVVQFGDPLPKPSLEALAQALSSSPDTELYVYGHYGLDIDPGLRFLDGFEAIEKLSINLHGLRSLDALSRFTRLRSLSIDGTPAKVSLRPLTGLTQLERLSLPGPVVAPEVLADFSSLRELSMPATQPLLQAITAHPSLERLCLHFGDGSNLHSLSTLSRLRDLEIWQIKKLSTGDLDPLGAIPKLEALALGAARRVDSLAFLTHRGKTLRYLHLEKVPSLKDLAPLAHLKHLRACGLFESRPVDQSLAPLSQLSNLRDLSIGDVYSRTEVDRLFAALEGTRIRVRQRETDEPSRLGWRGLFEYAAGDRGETLD